MSLPTLNLSDAKQWWVNRRSSLAEVDQEVDDVIQFFSSSPMTVVATLDTLIGVATPDDDLSLLGIWVVEEVTDLHGPTFVSAVDASVATPEQKLLILSRYRPPAPPLWP